MVRLLLIVTVAVIGMFVLGCAAERRASSPMSESKYEAMKRYEMVGDFHNAFLALRAAKDELNQERSDEQYTPAQFELDYLCSIAAWSGDSDQWTLIFRDPRISLEEKVHLVEWIHDGALKKAWQ